MAWHLYPVLEDDFQGELGVEWLAGADAGVAEVGPDGGTDHAAFAGVWQAGTSLGIIDTSPVSLFFVPVSTRHIRQLATTDKPGCQQ